MTPRMLVAPATGAATRLVSLDVFRGLTMAAMVIVNNPGDWDNVYPPLLHAQWHGWTPTDLIFPFFLFIVGVSVTLSRKSSVQHGSSTRRNHPGAGPVPRRISLLRPGALADPWRPAADRDLLSVRGRRVLHRAEGPARRRAAASSCGHSCGTGRRACPGILGGPHARSASGRICRRPLSRREPGRDLDRALMGNHLYKPRWDPEGLLSTIPAIATTLLGCVAGLAVKAAETPARAAGLAIAGIVGIVVGNLLGICVSDQQGPVDQFLRAVHGWPRRPDPGAARLGGQTSKAGVDGPDRW